ncbi:DedA family protein [Pseudarthrobacter sp. O4]|uniref:DedA family protein n=1 Tax=Pseudarthrobacter sp. O4 TaxID=3418417 RepID=UPI003CF8DD3F
MGAFIDGILNVSPAVAYTLVACLVFAEDALFVGFVIPGEIAAVLGGVIASRGEVELWLMMLLVILAAVLGDTVGYEIGRHFGPRLPDLKILDRHRARVTNAQEFLRRRGGPAVFLGRFVAVFRAVMPGLAGISRMHYPRFLAFNAAGGAVWGAGFVLLGFLSGHSYEAVAKTAGRDIAAVVAVLAVVAVIIWRVRAARRERQSTEGADS